MHRILTYFSFLILLNSNALLAQSVGIGTTTPDSSAILELSSTTQGLLIPRLTTSQRDAISNPANGLMILNLDDQCFDVYGGASWSKNCGFSIDTFPSPLWIKRSDFGGGGLLYGVGFSIGSKGYIGTGGTSQFWEYDPTTNSWTQKADFGGTVRQNAVGLSIGDKGYIGTGETGVARTQLGDFWEYDPIANSWTQKANYGGGPINRAVGFSIGDKGYIGTGGSSQFWEYDPTANIWTQKADFGGGTRYDAVGFSIGDKGYIGTGSGFFGIHSDFWEYDPITDSWIQKADFGGGGRENAVGFSIGEKGYIGTGRYQSNLNNDFWVYDPHVNTWSQLPTFPGAPRDECVGFSIGDKGYIGTGVTYFNTFLQDFWEYSLYPQQFSSNHIGEYDRVQDFIWTKSDDNIHPNELTSKVGIGTIYPQSKLHISQDGPVELSLQSNDVGSHRWTIQSNPGVTQFQIIDRTLNASRMAIDINGNVGIGTTSMANKLSVAGSASIQGSTSIGSAYAGIIAPANGAIIQGFLGIGTSSPQAPLHVRGISGINTGTNIRYFNYGTTSIGYGPNWQGQSVIYGEGNICATLAFISGTSFNFSDARIKHILGRSDAIEDLERLNQIKVTRYKHIDSIAYDNTIKTKVIAQELKEIMPEAVSYTQNFIPNIMQVAEQVVHMEDDEYLSVTLSNPHDLIPGDLLKCLDEKGQEIIGEVVAIPDSKVFQIRCDRPVSRLFVYGKQVDDFHIVDYDAISMLNVSATQELSRQLEELKREHQMEIDRLKKENQKLMEDFETRMSRIEATLNN